MSDRERIFAIIRKRLFHVQKIKFTDNYQSPLKKLVPDNFSDLLLQFKQELEALGGRAIQISSTDELRAAILANLKENPSIFITDQIMRTYPELIDKINKSKKYIMEKDLASLIPNSKIYKETVNSIDAAITGCLCTIAETGTIVISGNSRLPLAMAQELIVIIKPGQMLKTLDEFFTGKHFKEHNHSNLFMVTGPSQTADIEKELVKGVHGPKDVFAFFADK
jgi:Uncharacterized conserved protein